MMPAIAGQLYLGYTFEIRSHMSQERGRTRPAGEGLSDEAMAQDVGEQTDSNREHSDFFEREASGSTTDTEAAKATADELADDD